MLPSRLKRLLDEVYNSSLDELVKVTKEYGVELQQLHGKLTREYQKLPRIHSHRLEKYWEPEKRTEFGHLVDSLLESNYDKQLAGVVQKSFAYTRQGDVYCIPWEQKFEDYFSIFAGGSAGRFVGRILPPPWNLVSMFGGAGVTVYLQMRQKTKKNPFSQLGDALVKQAEYYARQERVRTFKLDENRKLGEAGSLVKAVGDQFKKKWHGLVGKKKDES